MDKVVITIANTILDGVSKNLPSSEIAQHILNLRYENGSRMLYIGAQKQEPPEYDHSLYMISAQDVAWVQKQMINAGWRKTEDNND